MTPSFQLLDTPLPPGVTVLEASAGTGKTYTLAALVLRLIGEEGIPIGKIVVTTYTSAATAELRDRIRSRLLEALDALDGNPHMQPTPFVTEFVCRHREDAVVKRRIGDALRDFDQATISTIHSFCHRMLQERTFESGTKPALELVPDESALVQESAEDFWRRNFSGSEPGLTPLALLEDLTPPVLAKLYRNAANHPMAAIRPDAGDARASGEAVLKLLADLRAAWPVWKEAVRRIFVTDADWAISSYAKPVIVGPKFDLVDLLATDLNAPLAAYRATVFFDPLEIAEKGVGKKKQLPSHAFMAWCGSFVAASATYAATTRSAFLEWAQTDLAARKERLGLVAFGDLLSVFHAALHRPGGDALATAIRARYEAALVDEFQDTDPIQAGIFERLFGGIPQRLFLIGDPKQAIYGFRGADLFTYLRVTGAAARRFRLGTNHRSDALLISAVNALFSRPKSPFIDPRVAFAGVAAARGLTERPLLAEGSVRPPMRFWFWDSEKPVTSSAAERELPESVASEIVRILQTGRLDDRALMPRDCAVLCSVNRQCQDMQVALAKRGVPSVVLTSASVFAADEAREFHIVMNALVSPAREASIRAALATRILGFDAIALERAGADSHEWERIIARFHGYLQTWREHGFIQMFRELIHAEQLRPRILALPQGDRRLTNLLHLAELLHSTAHEFQLGPSGLLRWFAEQLKNPGSGDERELRLERDDDAVKILTIHKSKGLEWPVVFCPFLWTKADLRDDQPPLFHDDADRAILDLGSPDRALAATRAGHEQLAERLRLLYVALTRAKHECHVVWGQFRDCENSALMWLLEPPATFGTDAPAALRGHSGAYTSSMLRKTLESIAGVAPDQIAVCVLPEDSAAYYVSAAAESAPGKARAFRGRIDRSWRVSSFTAFTALRDTEEADHDRDDLPVISGARQGIHAFPGGMKAGVCLHEIFERLDFTRPMSVQSLVESTLKMHGMHSLDHAVAVIQTVRKILEVPLMMTQAASSRRKPRKDEDADCELLLGDDRPPLRLSSVPMERTLRELEFHLPSALITPAQLSGFTEAGLLFEPRRGILKGFMDLVFEHDGRFHILDWKSNGLGPASSSYTGAAMWAEIVHHRYDLQWQLYLLALHRYLRLRLGSGYDPARHLGTVFYVFLRGVEPFQPQLGIHRTEPDLAALARLDALFFGT